MPIIRRATQDDIQEIARNAAAGWRHTYRGLISPEAMEDTLVRWYSTETMLRRLAGPPMHVAESARKIVGYVQHGPVAGEIYEVHPIYLGPAVHVKAMGCALW